MKKTIASLMTLIMLVGLTVSTASAFTPPGLNKKGGLPPGIQKQLERIIERTHNYEATINAIDYANRRIMIQDGTAEISLLVADNAKIELNGKTTTLNYLQVGDEAVIKTNSSNTIVELKVTGTSRTTPPKQTEIKGFIKSIDLSKKEMIVEENNITKLYKMSNTVVYVDNKRKALSDLKVGMEITATVEGIEIKTLYAKSVVVRELQATVKAVDVSKREVVLQYDKREVLYPVKSDAVIQINGVKQNLSAITVGTVVDVKIQQEQVIEITVNNGISQFEGRLMAKNLGTTPTITVEINKELKQFNISKELDLTHLNVGRQIVIYIKDNLVVGIHEKTN